MTAGEVNSFFWLLYPTYTVSFPSEDDKPKETKRFVDWVLEGQKEAPADMVKVSEPKFQVPEEFDEWPIEKRQQHLDELLDQESVTSWSGTDLRKVRSEKVEHWLQRSGVDMADTESQSTVPTTYRWKQVLAGIFGRKT